MASIDAITLSRWERGKQPPRAETVAVLAKAYGASVNQFFEESAQPRLGENVARGTSLRLSEPMALDLPRALRMRGNEVERDMIEAGATEQHVRDFWRSVRENPLLIALFSGGAPSNLSNEQMLQIFDGVALGFRRIVEELVRQETEARRR